MNATRRRLSLFTVLALSLFSVAATAKDAQPASAQSPKRSSQQLAQELQKVAQEIAPLFASPQELFDPQKRQTAAPKAIPVLRKMVKLLDEFQASRPAGAPAGHEKTQLTAMLSALGDKDATERLRSMAASPVAGDAASGRSGQLFAAWLQTDGKVAAQQKVVDDFAVAAKKYPNEPSLAAASLMLAGTTTADATDLRQKITSVVKQSLKGPAAQSAASQLDGLEQRYAAKAKLKAMEGKPLSLEGATPSGGRFSTADWKGKVVLVDFWATWCQPCRTELPKVKKLYAQYHAQGLEVIGICCDNAPEELVKFLGENRDMSWPQLFDAGSPGWHALATEYGISSIPTMFLIDRQGIVRSVDARESYEKLVPELLKEKP